MEDKSMRYLLWTAELKKEGYGPDHGPEDDRCFSADHRYHSDFAYLNHLR